MKNFLSKTAREIAPYTAGEQPADRQYVKLNTNENPYPPSPEALKAYRDYDFSSLKLYPPLEMRALREAIAAAEGVGAENVFCGNGSDEILALCFPAFFDADGEGAAFADVTYSFYPVFAEFFKIPKKILPLEEDFSLDLKKLTQTPAQGVIVANPNAPTGIGIPLGEIEAFVQENSGRVVILDEAYMPFFDQSAVPLTKKYDNLVVVKTFSKGYSLAGMRCGYAVADPALISGLERCRDCFNSYPVDRVCQAVCAAAIGDKAYYDRVNALVISERERLSRALASLGFTVLPSKANFVFAKHAALSGREVYEALRARGVLVRHFQKPRISEYCRITVGSREENDALLRALGEFIQ
ncbi:MAG TPA: histidinol-phosphate transaminase [Candidatus Borkfalkia avistercoris]|uniref:Histidinol-phosphate aminotransferase n=1 Tax=Candidatus Borkfalkia avistercoris TaxID=2838504 RepID=A0A9D2CZ00_9FIRM|nr:histidinol-phosphate transaminase [Candidatus Borkfalkia avistercoris]